MIEQLTCHVEKVSSGIDGVVVEEPVGEDVKGRLGPDLPDLLPSRSHPLTEKRIVDPTSDVDQVSILIDQSSGKVHRNIHARVRIPSDSSEGWSSNFFDQFPFVVEHGDGWAQVIAGDIEPAVGSVHGYKEVILVVEEVVSPGGLRVVNVRDGWVGVRVGVDELNDVAAVISLGSNPAEVVVVEPDCKFAGFVSRDHLTERVVEITLAAASNDEAAIVVRHKVEVSVRDDAIAAVHADVDAVVGHFDANDVSVNVVGEGPVVDAVIALDALELAVRIVGVHGDDGGSSEGWRFRWNSVWRIERVFHAEGFVAVDAQDDTVGSAVGVEVLGGAEGLGGVFEDGAPKGFVADSQVFDDLKKEMKMEILDYYKC